MLYVCLFGFLKKPHKGTKKISYMQINNVRARSFQTNTSIFPHFFRIYAHVFGKKAVPLHRELISGNADIQNE